MKQFRIRFIALFLVGCGVALPSAIRADIMPINFANVGITGYDGWTNLPSANPPNAGNSAWGPLESNTTGSGSSIIKRVAGASNGGGPILGPTSIYFYSSQQVANALGGTISVLNSSPVRDVKTIIFQIEIGEALGHDFYSPSGAPILKLNGASSGAAPSFSPILVNQYQYGTFSSPLTGDEPVYVNTWAFQWNLAGATNVDSFAIEFSCVTHSQIYALQLDQTSVLQANQIFTTSFEPPQIRLLASGTPQFDGANTTITHTFAAPAGKLLDIEFTQNLSVTNWLTNTSVSTGSGTFDVTFQATGDQRIAWAQRMFFRAKYSQNQ